MSTVKICRRPNGEPGGLGVCARTRNRPTFHTLSAYVAASILSDVRMAAASSSCWVSLEGSEFTKAHYATSMSRAPALSGLFHVQTAPCTGCTWSCPETGQYLQKCNLGRCDGQCFRPRLACGSYLCRLAIATLTRIKKALTKGPAQVGSLQETLKNSLQQCHI